MAYGYENSLVTMKMKKDGSYVFRIPTADGVANLQFGPGSMDLDRFITMAERWFGGSNSAACTIGPGTTGYHIRMDTVHGIETVEIKSADNSGNAEPFFPVSGEPFPECLASEWLSKSLAWISGSIHKASREMEQSLKEKMWEKMLHMQNLSRMKLPPVLYHLTTKENAAKIMNGTASGILPMIGKNAASVGEKDRKACLTDEGSLAHWMCVFPECDAVIKVVDPRRCGTIVKMGESEYASHEPIARIYCFLGRMPEITDEDRQKTCLDYMLSMGEVAVDMVRWMDHMMAPDAETSENELEAMEKTVDNHAEIAKRIGMAKWLDEDICWEALKELGDDGEYTMLDTYGDTDVTIIGMLEKHPCRHGLIARKKLKKMIELYIPGLLDGRSTGGYEPPQWCREAHHGRKR